MISLMLKELGPAETKSDPPGPVPRTAPHADEAPVSIPEAGPNVHEEEPPGIAEYLLTTPLLGDATNAKDGDDVRNAMSVPTKAEAHRVVGSPLARAGDVPKPRIRKLSMARLTIVIVFFAVFHLQFWVLISSRPSSALCRNLEEVQARRSAGRTVEGLRRRTG